MQDWRVTLRCTSMPRWPLHRKSAAAGRKLPGQNPHSYFFALRGLSVQTQRQRFAPLQYGASKNEKRNRTTGSGTERDRPCQPLALLLNFTTHCADLLSCQASSSLLRGKQSPDLASARQVGEIRDNRIKARGQRWLLFLPPQQKSAG